MAKDQVKIYGREGNGGTAVMIPVDSATNSLQTIEHEHHEIHNGSHFFLSAYTSLDTDGTLIYSITTPNSTKWAHIIWGISSTANVVLELKEGAAVSGGGAVTPLNSNRNSSKTSVLTIKSNPTVNTEGTVIASSSFGSTGANKNTISGGAFVRDNELVLKQNTTYQVKITSGADSNIIDYLASWYEHTDKN